MTDALKGNEKGAWQRDSLYATSYSESFQVFDVDAVPIETYQEIQPTLKESWFKAQNFKEGVGAALFTWVR